MHAKTNRVANLFSIKKKKTHILLPALDYCLKSYNCIHLSALTLPAGLMVHEVHLFYTSACSSSDSWPPSHLGMKSPKRGP